MEEARRSQKPHRMAVLQGIPADDDAEEAATRANSSQPRVVRQVFHCSCMLSISHTHLGSFQTCMRHQACMQRSWDKQHHC